jgi:hypothetical protein
MLKEERIEQENSLNQKIQNLKKTVTQKQNNLNTV